MAGIKLKLDKYNESQDLAATIIRVGSKSSEHSLVSGLIEAIPSLGVSISYTAPGAEVGDAANQGIQAINQAVGSTLVPTLNNLKNSTKLWSMSAVDPITVSILLTKPDSMKIAWDFYSKCFPTTDSSDSISITPPFWSGAEGGSGTVSLRLGNWFHAKNLVVDSCQVEPSQELVFVSTTKSRPVHAKLTITLSPSRRLTRQEVQGFYIGG